MTLRKDAGGSILESAKNFFNSILGKGGGNKDLFGSLEDVFGGSNVAGNLVKQYAAEKSNGQIPYLQGLKALLIGDPVGEWHVTIGNPLNPIAMIGNLVDGIDSEQFGNFIEQIIIEEQLSEKYPTMDLYTKIFSFVGQN